MRNDFFAHLETLPLSYFQTHRTGDLMSRATNDLNAVRMMIGPSIMYSANTLVYTVGALSFMISISPWLTLFTFLPLPAVSIVINRAKTESRREARSVPLSTLAAESGDTLPPTGARSPRADSSGRRRCGCSRRRSRRCPRRSGS